jgi:hypothetical protein
MRSTRSIVAVVLSSLVAVPSVSAQVHVAGQQTLDAAVQQHVRAAEQDRETVRLFLQRSEVRAIAGKYGVDIRRAESAVATMTPADLASIAAKARQADEALAGGQSNITISTTTIIILLLVLILLIVALN